MHSELRIKNDRVTETMIKFQNSKISKKSCLRMLSRAGLKTLAGRIWPAGRRLGIPVLHGGPGKAKNPKSEKSKLSVFHDLHII